MDALVLLHLDHHLLFLLEGSLELILGLSVLLLWGSLVDDGLLVLVNFFSFDLVEVLDLVLV